jgi:hypothetical protein
MTAAIPRHLPPGVRGAAPSAGSVLDPGAFAHLPPLVAAGIRAGLADALHNVFLFALPVLAIAFVATLLIREIPLRRTAHANVGTAPPAVATVDGRDGTGATSPAPTSAPTSTGL